jgi:hypothetical protein
MISRILIGDCAAIICSSAVCILAYTFFTQKFSPTEGQLETAMKQIASRISSNTTMWKAWVGFHISHSLGLMLCGLIYGYLTVCRWAERVLSRCFNSHRRLHTLAPFYSPP